MILGAIGYNLKSAAYYTHYEKPVCSFYFYFCLFDTILVCPIVKPRYFGCYTFLFLIKFKVLSEWDK